jgi:hypothetical protein
MRKRNILVLHVLTLVFMMVYFKLGMALEKDLLAEKQLSKYSDKVVCQEQI